ncbi:hypothetical protein BLOT_012295 [Blomia tropicalis]|nr:hypothetical protein BLOT_012295 [Blomia tropicalis]
MALTIHNGRQKENKNNKKLRFRTFILYSSMGTFGYVGVDHANRLKFGFTVTVKVLRRKMSNTNGKHD